MPAEREERLIAALVVCPDQLMQLVLDCRRLWPRVAFCEKKSAQTGGLFNPRKLGLAVRLITQHLLGNREELAGHFAKALLGDLRLLRPLGKFRRDR
ncbi:MAG: hypothetical protein ACRD9W_23350, partial [Terriglobia bacterium]